MSSNFNLSNETAPALEDQDDSFPLMDALPPLPGQESSYSLSYTCVGSFERSQLGGEETDMPNLDDNSVEVEEILAGRGTFHLDDNRNVSVYISPATSISCVILANDLSLRIIQNGQPISSMDMIQQSSLNSARHHQV